MSDKQKRIVVYMSPTTHQRLKVILAIEGKTVSQWFREKTNKELAEAGYEPYVAD